MDISVKTLATTSSTPQTNTVIEDSMEGDSLLLQFSMVCNTLNSLKTQISALQTHVKTLERGVKKEMKSLKKEASKVKVKGNRKPSGFARPSKISDDLCKFMNKGTGSKVARTEVTQYLIGYINENNLQFQENRKIIKPDERLTKLLNIKEDDELTYFNLQRYMNQHFIKETEKM